jgi:hypothetical protein
VGTPNQPQQGQWFAAKMENDSYTQPALLEKISEAHRLFLLTKNEKTKKSAGSGEGHGLGDR